MLSEFDICFIVLLSVDVFLINFVFIVFILVVLIGIMVIFSFIDFM